MSMAAALRISINEKQFIEAALLQGCRVDGRGPFEQRPLLIDYFKDDGTVEVQQGKTRILAVVSAELIHPYPERPNEGFLMVHTEFSPMADPSFDPGRPGESAVELGRIIERGLRESRAVDTESLCILTGEAVWALHLYLHILDNDGNLIDAANVAALCALMSFRRPDCSLGGEDSETIIVHPKEVKEPIPLILHHLPIALTFAFFGEGDLVVLDPCLKEEAVMRSRLTLTLNCHDELCTVQKGGGVAILVDAINHCQQVASLKAAETTAILKKSVEKHEQERAANKSRADKEGTEDRVIGVIVEVKEHIPCHIDEISKWDYKLQDEDQTSSSDEEEQRITQNGWSIDNMNTKSKLHNQFKFQEESIIAEDLINGSGKAKTRLVYKAETSVYKDHKMPVALQAVALQATAVSLGEVQGTLDTRMSKLDLQHEPINLLDAVKQRPKRGQLNKNL